jgi:hypothetical protein
MFDLNDEIGKWRSNLAESQTLETSDIDELESHLREEIEQLVTAKLSQQEAFWVARHRLGDADSLAEEFAKINASVLWRKRLFWAGVGLFSYIVAIYVARCVSSGLVVLAWFAGVKGYALGVLDTITQVVFFLAIIFVLYEVGRKKDRQGELFCKVAENLWGKFVLFASAFVVIAIMLAFRILVPATVARLSIREYGEMALFRAYTELVWTIVMPLILLTALIYLRPSRPRRTAT